MWCRLKEVCKYIQRGKSPKYSEEKRFPVISQKCVRWTGLDFKPMKYITEDSLKNYETVRFLCDGDILWNSTGTGTVGRAALYISESNPFPIAVADSHVTVLRPLNVLSDYIYKYIMSPHVQVGFEDLCDGSTNQKELSLTTVCDFLVPLPSQSEQARISSTVQELLEIIEAIDNDKTELSDLIKQTKAKILDLAIKGKLVPQDPNDEPADKLLEKIREEKEKLIEEGKLKRDKNETFIYKNNDDNSYYEQIDGETVCINDDLPFEIPDSWRWERLQNICTLITDGTHQTPTYTNIGHIFLSSKNVTTNKINWDNVMYISDDLHEKLYSRLAPELNDILLAKNGTIGKAALVDRDVEFDVYVTLAVIRLFKIYVLPQYIHKIIESKHIQDFFKGEQRGIGVPNLHLENIRRTLIPIPPQKEQNKIASKITSIFEQLDIIQEIFNK